LVQSGHSEKISSARVNEGIRTPSWRMQLPSHELTLASCAVVGE
jgi:hypothetical protein